MVGQSGNAAERPYPDPRDRRILPRARGRIAEARSYAEAIRRAQPRFGVEEYLNAFQFSTDAATLFRSAARKIGLT